MGIAALAMIGLVATAIPAQADTREPRTVTAMIKALPVVAETRDGYDRDLFRHWITTDGCTTREWVLIRQSNAGTRVDCSVAGGSWFSRYDGQATTNPSTFDIDHMVPLAEAWDSGASQWTAERRMAFANDLTYRSALIAVSAASNRSKGDKDPAEWMPPREGYWCKYLRKWVAIKYRWSLAVDRPEKRFLATNLRDCKKTIEAPPIASD